MGSSTHRLHLAEAGELIALFTRADSLPTARRVRPNEVLMAPTSAKLHCCPVTGNERRLWRSFPPEQ